MGDEQGGEKQMPNARILTQQALYRLLRLTPREVEVLCWVTQGKRNDEIGRVLSVSPRTVQKHLKHIYHKLGVRTRTAAVLRVLALTWYWSRQQPRDGPYRKPSMARLEEASFDGQAPAQRSRAT